MNKNNSTWSYLLDVKEKITLGDTEIFTNGMNVHLIAYNPYLYLPYDKTILDHWYSLHDKTIHTEFHAASWLRTVKFTEWNITQCWFLNCNLSNNVSLKDLFKILKHMEFKFNVIVISEMVKFETHSMFFLQGKPYLTEIGNSLIWYKH